jgi:signal peptidase I
MLSTDLDQRLGPSSLPPSRNREAAGAQAPVFASPQETPRLWSRGRHPGRLFMVAVALLALRMFVGEASVVPTGSMEGTILVGDHLFLNKLLYGPEIPLVNVHLPRWKTIRRGDIVVFRYPRNPEETFLKRVIAVGGDQVEIRSGVLYLNSNPVDEPYVVHRRPLRSANEQMTPAIVPAGSLFVMGDNRDNSSDSRDWGFVPEQNVIGEPLFVYWSYDAPSSRWLDPDFAHQMSFDVSIAGNFFSHTRWTRMGMLL